MSVSDLEYQEQDAYDRLQTEISAQAIADFKGAMLVSFYRANPAIAEDSAKALEEARALLTSSHESAALVFAGIASETFLKNVMIRGMMSGVIHHESLAEHIIKAVVEQTGVERFLKMLQVIFRELAAIDLCTFRPQSLKKTLWEEFQDAQKVRNAVCHKAQITLTRIQAEKAVSVAGELLDTIFPKVAKELGFHLHGFRLCDAWKCAPETVSMFDEMKAQHPASAAEIQKQLSDCDAKK